MPLVKKRIFLAAGATSDQVLSGTTYEYVDPNTVIRVAAAVDTAGPQQRQTQQWISPSTMQNLAEMHRYPPWSPASRSAPVRIAIM